MHDLRSGTPTRRVILSGAVATLAALGVHRTFAQEMQQKPSTPANSNVTTLHYEIEFKVSPQRIYRLLLEARQFADFTGMAAEIDAKPGGAFTLFDKMIEGRNVELVENQRIVQAWRPASWAPGVYSITHFELKPRAAESTLLLDHTGFPAGLADHLDSGWHGHYWEPMKKHFAAS
jgi:activator of HSP90 ATPase